MACYPDIDVLIGYIFWLVIVGFVDIMFIWIFIDILRDKLRITYMVYKYKWIGFPAIIISLSYIFYIIASAIPKLCD